MTTGKLIHRFAGHSGKIDSLQFSPDGNILFSSSWDGTTRLWRIPPYRTDEELFAWLLNNRYVRDLTCDEREQDYVLPLCAADGVVPATHTPYPTLTPSATPTITPTPNLTLVTATFTFTPSPTLTMTPTIPTATSTPTFTPAATATPVPKGVILLGSAVIGGIQGVPAPSRDLWTFEGTADQSLTISNSSAGLVVTLFAPNGAVIITGETATLGPVSLPVTGTYSIVVAIGSNGFSGMYSLSLK